MVKRLLSLFVISFTVITSYAQWFAIPNLTTFDDRKIHFGFTLGINTMDFGFKFYDNLNDNPLFDINSVKQEYRAELDTVNYVVRADIANLTPGFTVGIVSNLRLTKNLDLRFIPGLSFGNRKVVFNVPIHDTKQLDVPSVYSARATFLDFPLMIKYKSKRIVNNRPYIIGGVAYRYDISKSALDDLIQIRKSQFSLEAGMGWDLYLQFFRLSTEIKYSFGLWNGLMSKPPDTPQNSYYHLSIKSLSTNLLTLSFHFE